MEGKRIICVKIIKITALVLAFVLLIETFLCFLLSFAILEQPPSNWPQRLKNDCYPRWYGWFSLLLNSIGVVAHFYMYWGILKANKYKLYMGLLGAAAYLSLGILSHLVMLIEDSDPHTMEKLNWIGTGVSLICSPLAYLHYRKFFAIAQMETVNTEAVPAII